MSPVNFENSKKRVKYLQSKHTFSVCPPPLLRGLCCITLKLACMHVSARQCPYPGVPAGGEVTIEGSGFDYYDNATFSCLRQGFDPEVKAVRCGVSENGQRLTWGVSTPPACVGECRLWMLWSCYRTVDVIYYGHAGQNSGWLHSI